MKWNVFLLSFVYFGCWLQEDDIDSSLSEALCFTSETGMTIQGVCGQVTGLLSIYYSKIGADSDGLMNDICATDVKLNNAEFSNLHFMWKSISWDVKRRVMYGYENVSIVLFEAVHKFSRKMRIYAANAKNKYLASRPRKVYYTETAKAVHFHLLFSGLCELFKITDSNDGSAVDSTVLFLEQYVLPHILPRDFIPRDVTNLDSFAPRSTLTAIEKYIGGGYSAWQNNIALLSEFVAISRQTWLRIAIDESASTQIVNRIDAISALLVN